MQQKGIFKLIAASLFGLLTLFIFPIINNSVHADSSASTDTEVALNVDSVINISAPTTATINCTPGATAAAAQLCTTVASIGVGTNNITGYTLQMNATSGSPTALTNSAASPAATIPTLSQSYSSSNFPVNSWGYTGGLDKSEETGGYDCSTNYCPVLAYGSSAPNHVIKATNAPTTTSNTDITFGAKVDISKPSGTYATSVTFTAITNDPLANSAILDTGKTVNSKLKSLAATVVNGEETTIIPIFDPDDDYDWEYAYDEYIKSIEVHLETAAPAGFTPTEANTISSSASKKPIYIVFDNANDAGIMHFYTEGNQIILPSDASFMFYLFYNLADLSDISDWNTSSTTNTSGMFQRAGLLATTFSLNLSSWDVSNVVAMNHMFQDTGYSATTWSIGNFSSWDTSSVTDMRHMFQDAGFSATTWSIGDLSSWNTASVTDMSYMFENAGRSATTWSIGDLSNWNTSSVSDMNNMFRIAGRSATTWSIGDISGWNTSSVTDMWGMFCGAGSSATTFSLDLSDWNTSNVTNMSYMFEDAGRSATTFSLDISSWNTSSVTNMSWMFYSAGYSATTFSLDLSDWDTSNVTSMSNMFYRAGYSATTFSLDISSWNTSSVTSISSMFQNAGYSATTWSVTIPPTNGNGINNTTSRIYGQTTSVYGTPGGKSFTLAQ